MKIFLKYFLANFTYHLFDYGDQTLNELMN